MKTTAEERARWLNDRMFENGDSNRTVSAEYLARLTEDAGAWNKVFEGKKDTLYCSFCGKSQHEANHLFAGPAVSICDECAGLCTDILAEEKAKKVLQADFDRKLEAIKKANDRMMGDKQEARLGMLRACAAAVDEIRLPWFSVGSRWLKRTISRTFREMADRWEQEQRP